MSKGQSSFETLMVSLVVIVTSTFILSAFFELGDQTFALAILKAGVMEGLDKNQDFYVLKRIFYVQSNENTIEFDVIVVDDSIDQNPMYYMDLNSAAEKIKSKTKYSNLTIKMSGNQVYP
jgi:hypothetical protein